VSGGSADIGITQTGQLMVKEAEAVARWYAVQGDGEQLPQSFIAEVEYNVDCLGYNDKDSAVTLELHLK